MSAFGATAPTTTNSFYMFSKSGATQFCFSSSATSVVAISAETEAEIKPLLNANGLFWVQIVGVDVSDSRALLPRGIIEAMIP